MKRSTFKYEGQLNAGKLLMLVFFLASSIAVKGQSRSEIEYSADKMKYDRDYKGGAQRLIGNVVFKHEGSTITCDSAYKFSNNMVEAYDHVVIRKGDSLTITGKKLTYNGNTRQALLEGEVLCIDKEMTLTSNVLTFDVSKSIASYFGGGTIVSKNNTLTSKNGYYYANTRDMAFRYQVKLVNPEYTMTGDTLKYNTKTKTTFFLGPTHIDSKQNKIYCEKGWYNTETEKGHLTHKAVLLNEQTTLKADSINYNRKTGAGEAMGHVNITDTSSKIMVEGDHARNNEKNGESIVRGHTLFTQIMKEDSLFLTADTLFIVQKKIKAKNNTADTLQKDSTFIKAYHHVLVYKKDLQAVCDSLTYSSYDSLMLLHRAPLMWSGESQLSAKEIRIHTVNNKIKSFELIENALAITQIDSVRYNQIKGKNMEGFFVQDTIRQINVWGSAQAVYYVKNDQKKIMGLNKTDCSSMHLYMKKGEVQRVQFSKEPNSQVLPIKGLQPLEHRLKGFAWHGNKRPASKKELIKRRK